MENTFGDKPYSYIPDPAYVTLPPVPTAENIQKLTDEIEALQNSLQAEKNNEEHLLKLVDFGREELDRTKNSVKDALIQLYSQGDVTSEAAEYILESIGLETKVTKRVSGTISFSGDLEVSIFDDVDYVYSSDFNVESLSISRDYEDLDNLDYDVEDVDFES